MGEKEKFEIVKSDQANEVHLKSGDGLREKTYVIRSPRSLELRLSGSYIDRCPGFTKAQITVVRERTWGNASDLKSDPPHVARSLLKEVATALATIPDGLQSSFADGADETAELQPDDFTSISSGTLNPLVTHCPFDATPPSADESPPPEETPPSMNPSPTPSMNPSPTPAMNPSPTPAPTATPGPTSSPVPTPGLTPPH
jgi:hypothetical protein